MTAQPMSTQPFDPRSGSLVERALFNHRGVVVLLCALVTVLLGWQATKLRLNASFEKTIPAAHAYVRNFLQYQNELSGLGNAVRIAVANPHPAPGRPKPDARPSGADAEGVLGPTSGTIYDAKYLDTLRRMSDEVFLIPGVARNQMKSLWTPTTARPKRSNRCAPTSRARERSDRSLRSMRSPA
jgi:hypothetical protein